MKASFNNTHSNYFNKQGWFETLRIEGYSHNINVTMVCPGPVFSEILMHAFTETKEKVSKLSKVELCVIHWYMTSSAYNGK
jgi:short-subunit dehydrogenase